MTPDSCLRILQWVVWGCIALVGVGVMVWAFWEKKK